MADDATNAANDKQLASSPRYVKNGTRHIEERFLAFSQCVADVSGEATAYPKIYKKFSVLIGMGIFQDGMCCPFFAICISLYCCGQTLTGVKSDIIDIPDP